MINEEIANIFERMSRLLAFKGENRFRVLAYRRAAQSLRDLKDDLATTAREGRLDEIPGVGKDLASMIREYIEKGRIRRYDAERRGVPGALIDLMAAPGFGPKTVAVLHEKLSITSVEELNRAINSGALLELRGFGEKKVENLRRGLALWLSSKQRMPLGVALPMAEKLLDDLRKLASVERADVAGSVRRRRDTIGDLDLLIVSANSPRALREFSKLPGVKQVAALGETRATVIMEGGVQVDARAVEKNSYGAALQYLTGSKEHNVHLRTIARRRGLKLSEYGVFRGAKRVAGADERDVYGSLKLPLIPPELREDRGEIEAALQGRLPDLIELEELRGDLHAHTNYSDGRSTIEEMAARAAELGYEYIALTDHSPSSRIARGLDCAQLDQKFEEIEAARKNRPGRRPHLLFGAEVDILPNGKLDYPDDVLARFDVVTASIHSAFKQSKDKMTGRLIDAISNPNVRIIGHPTTRLLGSRGPVDFDLEAVIKAAGAALEINGAILRPDLTDTMARAAQQGGALLAINSDAHSAAQLDQIRYGVYQARRGWIEARSVVNSWRWPDLSSWLEARRSGRQARGAATGRR